MQKHSHSGARPRAAGPCGPSRGSPASPESIGGPSTPTGTRTGEINGLAGVHGSRARPLTGRPGMTVDFFSPPVDFRASARPRAPPNRRHIIGGYVGSAVMNAPVAFEDFSAEQ